MEAVQSAVLWIDRDLKIVRGVIGGTAVQAQGLGRKIPMSGAKDASIGGTLLDAMSGGWHVVSAVASAESGVDIVVLSK